MPLYICQVQAPLILLSESPLIPRKLFFISLSEKHSMIASSSHEVELIPTSKECFNMSLIFIPTGVSLPLCLSTMALIIVP